MIEENRRKPDKIPRIGCLGVGWIGRHRMQKLQESGAAEIVTICDPDDDCARQALHMLPHARRIDSFDQLLRDDLIDAVMIATPSAMHADQAIRALAANKSVFCQKPLGRRAIEVERVIRAAREVDRLLGVDLSYRHTRAMQAIRPLVQSGELGDIYAVNLVFHNAYGPDKPWFYDPEKAGGGCLIDLGIHLVDLALWALDWPQITDIHGWCAASGKKQRPEERQVEDFAAALIQVDQHRNGPNTLLNLACSWRLAAGRDCVIEAAFYGTRGGAIMRNIHGSFYDFVAERFHGTQTETLYRPDAVQSSETQLSDEWGAGAAIAWAQRLAENPGFDPTITRVAQITHVLDEIYACR